MLEPVSCRLCYVRAVGLKVFAASHFYRMFFGLAFSCRLLRGYSQAKRLSAAPLGVFERHDDGAVRIVFFPYYLGEWVDKLIMLITKEFLTCASLKI